MIKKKTGRLTLIFLSLLIVGSVIYNIYDNNRFKVVEQDVTIDKLPQSFDGFRILQISDLHQKYFGENQKNLLERINSLDYDMIAFTGDMNTYGNDSIDSSKAVLTLIDGIKNKENLFWVDGNTGPYAIESIGSSKTGELTEIGKVLQDKGCKILIYPYEITSNKESIWIVPEMLKSEYKIKDKSIDENIYKNIDGSIYKKKATSVENLKNIEAFYQNSSQWYEKLNGNGQVKIMLNHYPEKTNLSKEEWEGFGHLDYDLIIAGHNHGGQIRIPFYGALYIPDTPTSIGNGYFPKQSDVKGLNFINGIPQYISAGLGSSEAIELLGFRLFDTPEINVITLKCK